MHVYLLVCTCLCLIVKIKWICEQVENVLQEKSICRFANELCSVVYISIIFPSKINRCIQSQFEILLEFIFPNFVIASKIYFSKLLKRILCLQIKSHSQKLKIIYLKSTYPLSSLNNHIFHVKLYATRWHGIYGYLDLRVDIQTWGIYFFDFEM